MDIWKLYTKIYLIQVICYEADILHTKIPIFNEGEEKSENSTI